MGLRSRLASWLGRRPPGFVPPTDGKIRLNLGCGDKILPGYVNVDVAPSRKGAQPDLVCDLKRIPLPDEHADEILAVHVIEHFYYWEVHDVLDEWLRLLKPGGKLVLECPNLLSAARELLRNPRSVLSPSAELRRTMWVFYGDPAWRDPLMCHRWGYTPDSLKQLLRDSGLHDVRQEPALFKEREPRDMRITGIKGRPTVA